MARPKRNVMLIAMVKVARIAKVQIQSRKRGQSFTRFLADALDSPVLSFSEDNAKKMIRESNKLKGHELLVLQNMMIILGSTLYAIMKNDDVDIDGFLAGMLKAARQINYYHIKGLYEFDNLGAFEPMIQQLKQSEADIYKIPVEQIPAQQLELVKILNISNQFIDNPELMDSFRT